jgi:hypothetical protein
MHFGFEVLKCWICPAGNRAMRAKETACNVTSELGTMIKGDAKISIQARNF